VLIKKREEIKMNTLTVSNKNGQLVADSREVAEITGMEHKQLLRKIRTYSKYLTLGKMNFLEFFMPSNYQDLRGQTRPYYLLTRKGCDLIANKLTGEKGVIFTATYVTRFEEMENTLKNTLKNTLTVAQLTPELQMFKQIFESVVNSQLEQNRLSQEIESAKKEVEAIREVIEIMPSKEWRNETNALVKKICFTLKDYKLPKEEIYKSLQQRAACDLKRRLENLRYRYILNGGNKSRAEALNYLDVISEDKKLIEIYTAIVKEMAIKHKVA
jgi:Rha family phage regulatory protein